MLSPRRDVVAAKHFLQMALWRTGQVRPRVINVDGNASYPPAIAELKESGALLRRCRCRPSPYLNNILETGSLAGEGDVVGQVRFIERVFGIAA